MDTNKSKLIAIITIYRNDKDDTRRIQKDKFLERIKFLKKYGNFDVFLIEQSEDGNKFNIGKLKNIGFDIASNSNKNYDFFIFTDIDVLPDDDLSKYYFNVINGIASLGIRGTRYSTNNCFTGTCIGLNKKSFKKINGYPNNFWGWGGEDHCLHMRCNINKIKFFSPSKGSVIDIEEKKDGKKLSQEEKNIILKQNKLKEMRKREKIILDRKIWKNNGLNNLIYSVKSSKISNSDKYSLFYYKVDLQYKTDEKKFRHWYDISKYEKMSSKESMILFKKVNKKYFWCKFKYY